LTRGSHPLTSSTQHCARNKLRWPPPRLPTASRNGCTNNPAAAAAATTTAAHPVRSSRCTTNADTATAATRPASTDHDSHSRHRPGRLSRPAHRSRNPAIAALSDLFPAYSTTCSLAISLVWLAAAAALGGVALGVEDLDHRAQRHASLGSWRMRSRAAASR